MVVDIAVSGVTACVEVEAAEEIASAIAVDLVVGRCRIDVKGSSKICGEGICSAQVAKEAETK